MAIGALAGCAATGPLSGDPCWGFFACTGWHWSEDSCLPNGTSWPSRPVCPNSWRACTTV